MIMDTNNSLGKEEWYDTECKEALIDRNKETFEEDEDVAVQIIGNYKEKRKTFQ